MDIHELKPKFTKVLIKYSKDRHATVVGLLDGDACHIGVAYRHPDDQFNKKLSRRIATGRAWFQYQMMNGNKTDREHKEHLTRYTIMSNNPDYFYTNLLALVYHDEKN